MSLKRNTAYNAVGTLLPLIVSLATIPLLLRQVGEERFGIIALVWLLFGYFGLFDLGLSKATANRLARPENQAPQRQAELFWTALPINAFLGVAGGTLLYVAAEPVFTRFFDLPAGLEQELRDAIPWVACLLPLSTISAVWVGTLESRERFLILNVMYVVGGSLTYLSPLLAIHWFGPRIDVAVAATALTRLVTSLPLAITALRQIGRHRINRPRLATVKDLFGYGGWITATNIIGPVLVSIDQFMIGSIVGLRSVPHYSIPFNLATKVLILPGAISRALFPRLSKFNSDDARQRAKAIAGTLSLVLILVCVPLILVAELGLRLWLGPEFAKEATTVTRILLFGVWINGIAFVPYTFLESQGRPDLPAKLHALELVPFVALLWVFLQNFGLLGAAMAWAIRVAIDAALLFWLAGFSAEFVKRLVPPFGLLCLTKAFALVFEPSDLQGLLLALVGIALISVYSFYRDPIIRSFVLANVVRRQRQG